MIYYLERKGAADYRMNKFLNIKSMAHSKNIFKLLLISTSANIF